MAKLPFDMNSIDSIIKSVDSQEVPETKYRHYLGMSGIGHTCARHLFYSFHLVAKKSNTRRSNRIFERGHWEEQRIIRDLSELGIRFYRVDESGKEIPITGKYGEKQEMVIGFAGHVLGHIDGRCIGVPTAEKTPHLSEFKTANEKGFNEFQKKGCKEASPVYYAQQQRYMHGKGLTRSLFIVTNKNTEMRYAERIAYDKSFAEDLVRKEQHIIMSDMPLEKIGGPAWYECKFCNHNGVCHYGEEPWHNCRTCDHSDILNDGKWACSNQKVNKELTFEEQLAGCSLWRKGWGL